MIISIPKSAYLLDILHIGATKYSELKIILKSENVQLPPYREISLANEILIVNPEDFPAGIPVSYYSILCLTVEHILLNSDPITELQYPLSVKISHGLDGSGSHRIFNQVNVYPDFYTQKFHFVWI